MYTKAMEIFAIIISAYLGSQAVVDLKYNSNSSASVQSMHTKIEEDVVSVITSNVKEEDYEIS
jgi:hypothetical protein